jgi:hypothetical protein
MGSESISEILVLRSDVVVTALEREAVLLDLATKYFYSVNPSGWAITQLFEGGATREEARARAGAWGANGSIAEVNAFIERLVAEKLVAASDAPAFEADVTFDGTWSPPTIDKHKEPLQRVMVSAFDPTLPLAE